MEKNINLHEVAFEVAARAMKAELKRQLLGKPMLGDEKTENWYSDGGSMDLTELAKICVHAYEDSMRRGLTSPEQP